MLTKIRGFLKHYRVALGLYLYQMYYTTRAIVQGQPMRRKQSWMLLGILFSSALFLGVSYQTYQQVKYTQLCSIEQEYSKLVLALKQAHRELEHLTVEQKEGAREGTELWLGSLLNDCDQFLYQHRNARHPYAALLRFHLAQAHQLLEQVCAGCPTEGLEIEGPMLSAEMRSHQLLSQACDYLSDMPNDSKRGILYEFASLRAIGLSAESRHILAIKKQLVGLFGLPDKQLEKLHSRIHLNALQSIHYFIWGDVLFYRRNDREAALKAYRRAMDFPVPHVLQKGLTLRLKCLHSYRTCNEDLYDWTF